MATVNELRVAFEIADTEAEGPGRRYAIWLQGCPMRCPGCCNPEFLPESGGSLVAVDELAQRIERTPHIEGVTLLGGEPFFQACPAAALLEKVHRQGRSTMVFSGYTLAELENVPHSRALLADTDLLVDGRYDRTRPDTTRRWIGSTNQVMHFLTERYTPSDPVFHTSDTLEIRFRPGLVTINGRPSATLLDGRSPK